ncbi:5-oxoprolinase subunit PxpA [Allorhizobium pseudoryzae]|uniref:5-oxoprolinase subunit PxpA n=1 Tax=Allorhizobium pseudoryzae TaxID=379684 RepID=UPI003CFEFFB5
MTQVSGVTINCDIGEGFAIYRPWDDAGIMPHIHIANVACGFHASDPVVMRETVLLAAKNNVPVGAHPSFPDKQGFGRRDMIMDREELAACIRYQVGALKAFLDAEGLKLNHIKPHGALFGAATRREEVANAIADVALQYGVPVIGLPGSVGDQVYKARSVPFIAEYYADNDYEAATNLIVTRGHGVRDPNEVANRCVRMLKEGKAPTIKGVDFDVQAQTICVHSDTPNVVEMTRALRKAITPWAA